MRRTIFNRIGSKLRQQERPEPVVMQQITGRRALQHFINDNVLHLATIDYTRPAPVSVGGYTPTRKTSWGMVYHDRVEWLIPYDAFVEHCKRKLKIDADVALMHGVAERAVIPSGKRAPTQMRPNPGITGIECEYVVFVVRVPKIEET